MRTHDNWAEQARDRAIRRFFQVPEREEMSDAASRNLITLRDHVIELGAFIDLACPEGRDKVLALESLEHAFIRANRAIYGEELL